MSVLGVKIDQFNAPVCNSFRPKLIKDQLCYTVDPNVYKDKIDLKGELSLSLFIHFNEDRQMEETDSNRKNSVIVDIIGKKIYLVLYLVKCQIDYRATRIISGYET